LIKLILEILYQLSVYQRLYNWFSQKESLILLEKINKLSELPLSLEDFNVFKILILINEFNQSGILKLIL